MCMDSYTTWVLELDSVLRFGIRHLSPLTVFLATVLSLDCLDCLTVLRRGLYDLAEVILGDKAASVS